VFICRLFTEKHVTVNLQSCQHNVFKNYMHMFWGLLVSDHIMTEDWVMCSAIYYSKSIPIRPTIDRKPDFRRH